MHGQCARSDGILSFVALRVDVVEKARLRKPRRVST